MSIENSTTPAPAAMLTEKELWALFVNHVTRISMSMGPTIEQFKPDDLLRDPGEHQMMASFTDELADALDLSDTPESDIDCYIGDVETYLWNLKLIRDNFNRVKSSQLVDTEESDDEPLYNRPVIVAASEAA